MNYAVINDSEINTDKASMGKRDTKIGINCQVN